MELFFLFSFTLLTYCFFKFFSKKLLILLILETLMLYLILILSLFSSSLYFSIFNSFILSLIMVLDSVFGVSMLISSSRMSNNLSIMFIFV